MVSHPQRSTIEDKIAFIRIWFWAVAPTAAQDDVTALGKGPGALGGRLALLATGCYIEHLFRAIKLRPLLEQREKAAHVAIAETSRAAGAAPACWNRHEIHPMTGTTANSSA